MTSMILCPFPLFLIPIVALVFMIEGYRRKISNHLFSGILISGLDLLGICAFIIAVGSSNSLESVGISTEGILILGLLIGTGITITAIGLAGLLKPQVFCPTWPKGGKTPKKSSSR